MDVIEAIRARYSVRDFKADPIPEETAMKILEAATRSPSSGNSQPWEIFVAGGKTLEKIRGIYADRFEKGVQGKPELAGTPPDQQPAAFQERMSVLQAERAELLGQDPKDPATMRTNMMKISRFYGAPLLLALCMERTLNPSATFNMGLLTQTICLAAQGLGIGSLIAGWFISHPDVLRQELGIPDNLIIVAGIGLGYPNNESIINTFRSSRRPIQEVVRYKG
jgi:nitroreductase